MSDRPTVQINLRVTPEEKEQMRLGAQLAGTSLHRFLIDMGLWGASQYTDAPPEAALKTL